VLHDDGPRARAEKDVSVASTTIAQPAIDRSPWWTAADAAELDVLVHELVSRYFEHRPRCASCAAGDPPCPHLREAIEAVVDWREARALLSRAEYLRVERSAELA
jgi:hypothetical protein